MGFRIPKPTLGLVFRIPTPTLGLVFWVSPGPRCQGGPQMWPGAMLRAYQGSAPKESKND